MDSTEHFSYRGALRGHGGWVTAIAAPQDGSDMLLSASRDKSVLQWDISAEARSGDSYGKAKRALLGHSDFVQDVQISSDGQFALTGSWDKTLRLWELSSGSTVHTCQGHTKDVMSVAFSVDNRQIVSGSRDRVIKVWNTLGECKYTIQDQAHKDWVSCVRFSPNASTPIVVSGGWDKMVKVWSLTNFKLQQDLEGHTGYINTVTISPDGSLCASGGKDGIVFLWDLHKGEKLYELGDSSELIHALTFSPNRYWLCAATESKIKIWDLETKQSVAELMPESDESDKGHRPECISIAWSADGSTLYSGYTDNVIRVWGVTSGLSG
eukprot:NODE_1412_length_1426_cov_102.917211_g1175_i0.p1 GENE.NODE_1412_length_1426_cov_102.917211_g1175_i0~~NODE_1412_length_1426_cov_102.917211_g1175_i0.p1  ORF type:complete len:324 (+),score=109.61 NODE_1412_length_1426_cov_102.917211_g1175_i0:102-1073(+)